MDDDNVEGKAIAKETGNCDGMENNIEWREKNNANEDI